MHDGTPLPLIARAVMKVSALIVSKILTGPRINKATLVTTMRE
jgi:hypothetical protein